MWHYFIGPTGPVTKEDLSAITYVTSSDEWQDGDPELEMERIIHGLTEISKLSEAEPFITPVDLDAYPSYCQIVPFMTDIGTITEKLKNKFFRYYLVDVEYFPSGIIFILIAMLKFLRRIDALIWEVKLIEKNAKTFNIPDSDICHLAKKVTKLALDFIRCKSIRFILLFSQFFIALKTIQFLSFCLSIIH